MPFTSENVRKVEAEEEERRRKNREEEERKQQRSVAQNQNQQNQNNRDENQQQQEEEEEEDDEEEWLTEEDRQRRNQQFVKREAAKVQARRRGSMGGARGRRTVNGVRLTAPPTEEEKAKLGPLAAKVAEDAANGKGPTPAKTPEEKKQVEDVLNNADLRDLLMSPKTQGLMQRCADPREFQRAMMDPEERAIIHKLADAGLVKLER